MTRGPRVRRAPPRLYTVTVENVSTAHDFAVSGEFNTPVGAGGPAPIGPGEAYEFAFGAAPGSRLYRDVESRARLLVPINGPGRDFRRNSVREYVFAPIFARRKAVDVPHSSATGGHLHASRSAVMISSRIRMAMKRVRPMQSVLCGVIVVSSTAGTRFGPGEKRSGPVPGII